MGPLLLALLLSLAPRPAEARPSYERTYRKCVLALTRKAFRFGFIPTPRHGLNFQERLYLDGRLSGVASNRNYLIWGNEQMSNEQILVLNDLRLDPYLVNWLGSRSTGAPTLALVETLSREVSESFMPAAEVKHHLQAVARYEVMTGAQIGQDDFSTTGAQRVTRIGDFLENRIGECRHKAVLLAFVLNRLGIKASVATGSVYRADLYDRILKETDPEVRFQLYSFASEGNHAWVEFKLDGKNYWVDPHNSIAPVAVEEGVKHGPRFKFAWRAEFESYFVPYQGVERAENDLLPLTKNAVRGMKIQ